MNSCKVCSKDIDQTNSFKCDFCSSFFHNVCNFYVNQDDIQAGCCLNCNCELFPFSSCYSLDENDSRINYFHTSFKLNISLMNQISFSNTFSENTEIPSSTCNYLDCDDFNKIFTVSNSNKLSLFHLNINSLAKHFENLNSLLNSIHNKFEIIGISETRINRNSIPLNFNIPGYSSIFNNTESATGGTALYISNSIDYKSRNDLSNHLYLTKELESSFCELNLRKQQNIVIGCIYKHPIMDTNAFIINYLNPLLQKLHKENKQIILLGDFNIDLLKFGSNNSVDNFIDSLQSFSLIPSISLPTRITENSKTLIDNIFHTPSNLKTSSGNLLVGISDHLPQFLFLEKEHYKSNINQKFYRDWKSFNQEKFVSDFESINWENQLSLNLNNPDVSFDNFYEKISSLINHHVPLKMLTRKQIKNSSKPWITSGIRKSIKERDKLLASFIKESDPITKTELHTQYKIYRNRLVTLIRLSKTNHLKTYFHTNLKNSKNIWKGINELVQNRKINHNHETIKLYKDGTEIKQESVADEFNIYFTTIADKIRKNIEDSNTNFHDNLKSKNPNSFVFKTIEPLEITKIIKSLKLKSSGPNSIPNRILTILSKQLSTIFSKLFNLSFQTGKFPSNLKLAKVIPIFKNKGSSNDVSNYRPISLLSNIDKIFEKLVHSRVTNFLEQHNSIFMYQFGFRNKHSTNHALINLTEKIRRNCDKNLYTCGIFIDLQKAFDTVDHKILLSKLEHYGIRGIQNNWFKSYLSNRQQFVFASGTKSTFLEIKHGVPQGSVLGPLLFLIYINDLPSSIKNSIVSLFADDTCLLSSDKNLESLNVKINDDLQALSNWLKSNKISLNATKTEVIIFRSKRKKLDKNLNLFLDNHKLETSKKVKYLGVILDEHLEWSSHFEYLSSKLRKANGMLLNIRQYLSLKLLISVYYSLFHSHLSYATIVWGQNIKPTSRIFILQKQSVRILTSSNYDSHSKPLFSQTKIPTLSNIVFKDNVKIVYESLNKLNPKPIQNTIITKMANHQYATRNQSLELLTIPKVKTQTYGINSIQYQSLKNWNQLILHFRQDLSSISPCLLHKKITEFKSDS